LPSSSEKPIHPGLSELNAVEPFANQNALIKVLRFEGVYAFVTSISHRFLSIFRERVGCSLGGRGASIRYC